MERESNSESGPDKLSKRNYKLKEDTLRERIRYHLIQDRKLSQEDTKILIRWQAAHSLLLSKKEPDANVVKILMKTYGISNFTAYQDIRNAKFLFGDAGKSTAEAMRYMVTQWAIEMYSMAYIVKDFNAMSGALGKIIKANNLDKEDPDLPDPSKIQPPVQLLSVDFSFINSPYFEKIDEEAKKAVFRLYHAFMERLKESPLVEYSELFKLDEGVRPKKRRNRPSKKKPADIAMAQDSDD